MAVYFLSCEAQKLSKAISQSAAAHTAVKFTHWLRALRCNGKRQKGPFRNTLSPFEWESQSNDVPAADRGGHGQSFPRATLEQIEKVYMQALHAVADRLVSS